MAKATKTIKQALLYQPQHTAWFAQTQALFNHVVAFYFEEVLAAHPGILELSDKEALTALERLTHTTRENPHPLVPLSAIAENLPAVFRRAAIHAALGSARSFHTQLARWRMRKEQAQVRGKKCTIRPPLPPRQWNRSGILAVGEQDNVRLWAKVRHLDEQTAHLVSHHIVAFAQAHGATILTFEHLGNLKPEKGRYSRSANSKRMYWLKGRIFAHSKYKAWNTRGIITCRVSPRNTSRECARCGAPVARYAANQPVEGYTPGAPLVYCPACGMRGHADRNASIVIGQRLIMKYRSQEKPHAPLAPERPVKAGGVAGSQDAESKGRLSTDPAGHGASNEQGTAQDTSTGMAEGVSGIPRQLRWLSE
jgi:hypothetical protein